LKNPLTYNEEFNSSALNNYTTKFTIGEEKCNRFAIKNKEICNVKLMSDTSYGLMARIFTSHGFRDTAPIYFKTFDESLWLPTEPVIIASASIVSIVLISVIIVTTCWWHNKRQRKIRKKKEAAETVENLLSFTSYCVIDKNPLPKNQFDQLL
jgi:hypothetical protein